MLYAASAFGCEFRRAMTSAKTLFAEDSEQSLMLLLVFLGRLGLLVIARFKLVITLE